MAAEIRIKGQAELERAFLQLRRDVLRELRPALRKIAEPIRADAEAKAVDNISHIGDKWFQMRVGVTVKSVYVAPKQRRHGGSPRPNLGGLLMDKAMQPALDEHTDEAVAALDALVDVNAAKAGFF